LAITRAAELYWETEALQRKCEEIQERGRQVRARAAAALILRSTIRKAGQSQD
jgi:hypothetical protein